MIRRVSAIVALLLLAATAPPSSAKDGTEPLSWDALLQAFVEPGGWVDYGGLLGHRASVDDVVMSFGSLDPEAFAAEPEAQRLATLINAYNAFTVQLILEHWDGGELRSIRDLHEGNPWDAETFTFAGQAVTLNQLEHDLIRGNFDEPRIHWAVVCAAYSCPPLRPEAYTADRLETQLADQEAVVLGGDDPRFLRHNGKRVAVTKLFEWYGGDFGDDWRDYVRDRLPNGASIERFSFLEYDWSLNDTANRP